MLGFITMYIYEGILVTIYIYIYIYIYITGSGPGSDRVLEKT